MARTLRALGKENILTSDVHRRLFLHLLRIVALMVGGTVGYMVFQHWNWLDSLFMTVTTLTTVGYGEVHALSVAGRIYTIVFILCGVGLFLYIVSDIVEIFLEANPTAIFGLRQMKKHISQLSEHQIVCGFGRTGAEVCKHFHSTHVSFVVIDEDPAQVKKAEQAGFLVLEGDASADELLKAAGIEKASGIICALPDDTANTFIALSARAMNEKITIVCRSANPGAEAKMRLAGAHMVISPFVICGRRMATAVTHPLVTEFLDVVMHTPGYDLRMEQIGIAGGSALAGSNLGDAAIRKLSGAMVLALTQDGKLITNPSTEMVFQEGDVLIALGTEEQLRKLADLAGARPN